MAHWHPPTLDELLYESEHKRSIHPTLSDGEVLDDIKQYLESKKNTGIPHVQQLIVLKRKPGPFRLPNGQLCHYAKTPKVMSTSVSTALARAMPWLWIGASKFWGIQRANSNCHRQRLSAELKSGKSTYRFNGFVYINLPCPIEKPHQYHCFVPEPFRHRADTAIRFCILRDPVERFFSCWEELHMWRAKKAFKTLADPEKFLHAISHPDTKQQYWNDHHESQSYFLGEDSNYYTHIFSMNDVARLEAFLSEITGWAIKIPHAHKGKRQKYTPAQADKNLDIPASFRQRIEAHYAQDYKIWGKYF